MARRTERKRWLRMLLQIALFHLDLGGGAGRETVEGPRTHLGWGIGSHLIRNSKEPDIKRLELGATLKVPLVVDVVNRKYTDELWVFDVRDIKDGVNQILDAIEKSCLEYSLDACRTRLDGLKGEQNDGALALEREKLEDAGAVVDGLREALEMLGREMRAYEREMGEGQGDETVQAMSRDVHEEYQALVALHGRVNEGTVSRKGYDLAYDRYETHRKAAEDKFESWKHGLVTEIEGCRTRRRDLNEKLGSAEKGRIRVGATVDKLRSRDEEVRQQIKEAEKKLEHLTDALKSAKEKVMSGAELNREEYHLRENLLIKTGWMFVCLSLTKMCLDRLESGQIAEAKAATTEAKSYVAYIREVHEKLPVLVGERLSAFYSVEELDAKFSEMATAITSTIEAMEAEKRALFNPRDPVQKKAAGILLHRDLDEFFDWEAILDRELEALRRHQGNDYIKEIRPFMRRIAKHLSELLKSLQERPTEGVVEEIAILIERLGEVPDRAGIRSGVERAKLLITEGDIILKAFPSSKLKDIQKGVAGLPVPLARRIIEYYIVTRRAYRPTTIGYIRCLVLKDHKKRTGESFPAETNVSIRAVDEFVGEMVEMDAWIGTHPYSDNWYRQRLTVMHPRLGEVRQSVKREFGIDLKPQEREAIGRNYLDHKETFDLCNRLLKAKAEVLRRGGTEEQIDSTVRQIKKKFGKILIPKKLGEKIAEALEAMAEKLKKD